MRPVMSAGELVRQLITDYDPRDNDFNGDVNWVQIDLEKDDHDHMISPEDRFRLAMARQ
jgi:hypothetical protein